MPCNDRVFLSSRHMSRQPRRASGLKGSEIGFVGFGYRNGARLVVGEIIDRVIGADRFHPIPGARAGAALEINLGLPRHGEGARVYDGEAHLDILSGIVETI